MTRTHRVESLLAISAVLIGFAIGFVLAFLVLVEQATPSERFLEDHARVETQTWEYDVETSELEQLLREAQQVYEALDPEEKQHTDWAAWSAHYLVERLGE